MYGMDKENREIGGYTTKQIANREEPILHVSHDSDGDWQFLPYTTPDDKDAVLIHIEHLLDWDASLKEVMDLPLGWHASRKSVNEPWKREEWLDTD
jgi:hypothetical protein